MADNGAINDILDDEGDEFPDFPLHRRRRWIRERNDFFLDLDDRDFAVRFRLSKESSMEILLQIQHSLEYDSERNNAISPMNQLLCALRYYATGSTQISAADFSGFSKSTANRIIHRVSNAIATLCPQYIKFPETRGELERTQREFYTTAAFPRTIGAIDCTHVKISSPGGNDAEVFRNRKNYFSLNTQVICNSRMEIIDIVARWPGSAHDMHIFNNCLRKARFESGIYGNCVLVADAGYQNLPYIMMPLDRPVLPQEVLYNESQIRTRNVVERLFGVWKRRFPVLSLGINSKLNNTMAVIVATGVLHNVLRRRNDAPPPDDPDVRLPLPWEDLLLEGQIPPVQQPGRRCINPTRMAIVNDYFGALRN